LASIEYFDLGLDSVDRYPGWIDAVTAADGQRVARTYLDPDTDVVAVVANLPGAKITESGKPPPRRSLRRMLPQFG
jgi:predicted Zn-dependent peptidase